MYGVSAESVKESDNSVSVNLKPAFNSRTTRTQRICKYKLCFNNSIVVAILSNNIMSYCLGMSRLIAYFVELKK